MESQKVEVTKEDGLSERVVTKMDSQKVEVTKEDGLLESGGDKARWTLRESGSDKGR